MFKNESPAWTVAAILTAVAILAIGLGLRVEVEHTTKSYADGLADGRAECVPPPSRIENAARWLAEPTQGK